MVARAHVRDGVALVWCEGAELAAGKRPLLELADLEWTQHITVQEGTVDQRAVDDPTVQDASSQEVVENT